MLPTKNTLKANTTWKLFGNLKTLLLIQSMCQSLSTTTSLVTALSLTKYKPSQFFTMCKCANCSGWYPCKGNSGESLNIRDSRSRRLWTNSLCPHWIPFDRLERSQIPSRPTQTRSQRRPNQSHHRQNQKTSRHKNTFNCTPPLPVTPVDNF